MEWNEPKVSVRYLLIRIKNGTVPPSVVSKDGVNCETIESALSALKECEERGITAL